MITRKLYILSILFFTVISCHDEGSVQITSFAQVANVQWRAKGLQYQNQQLILLDSADSIFVKFADNRTYSGYCRGYCTSSFRGYYTISGLNSIRVDSGYATIGSCPNSRYGEFSLIFTDMASYHFNNSDLTLLDTRGNKVSFTR